MTGPWIVSYLCTPAWGTIVRTAELDPADPVLALARELEDMPPDRSEGMVLGRFRGTHRKKEKEWAAACAIGIDADMPAFAPNRKTPLPPGARDEFERAARAGEVPGSIAHATPGGLRLVFVLSAPITSLELYETAWRGALAIAGEWFARSRMDSLVSEHIEREGIVLVPGEVPRLHWDEGTKDPTRFWYGPRGNAVILTGRGTCDPAELIAAAPAPVPREPLRRAEVPITGASDTRWVPYWRTAFEPKLADIRSAPRNTRNTTLNAKAWSIARTWAGLEGWPGRPAASDVIAEIEAAGKAAGLPEWEVRASVRSGWRDGIKKPKYPAERPRARRMEAQ